MAYSAGQSCTINVRFGPKFSGTRYGAAVVYDNSGNALATRYVQGTGIGPQINFLPGTETTIISSGLSYPSGVAVDGSGNVYVMDTGNARLVKATPNSSGYSMSTVTTGLSQGGAYGVAVDGAGNLYVGDSGNQRVLKEQPSPAGYIETTIASGFGYPSGIAVDGSGDVFVIANDSILEFTPSPSGYVQSTVVAEVPNAQGLAVDSIGNLYVAEQGYGLGNFAVYKETLTPNGYIQTALTVPGQRSSMSVAVDSFGNVYYLNSPNVYKQTLTPNGYVESAIVTDLTAGDTYGIAVDGSGNLFIGYPGGNSVVKADFADAPSLNFANTAVNTTSPDSPLTVTLGNVGTAPLLFEIPSAGTNPSISPNFTLDSSGPNDCPLVSSGAQTPGTLNPQANCLLPISYTPLVAGPVTGTLSITHNNLNAPAPAYASQSVTLNGTDVTPTFTISSLPSTLTFNQGASSSSTVTITPQPGFNVNANLSVSGLPSGVTAAFSQNPTRGASVLTFTASTLATPGTATVTVTATFGSQQETTTISLQIMPLPGYYLTVSVSPAYLNVPAGSSGTATITTATHNGYNSAITFSVCSPPITNASVTFTPSSIPAPGNGSTTMTISVGPNGAVAWNGQTGSIPICLDIGGTGYSDSINFWLYSYVSPVITWPTPSAITYGAALTASQLNATANTQGTFSYSPAAGVVLGAGTQTLSVTFTPSASMIFSTATSIVQLKVNKATPTLTWASPAAITYGTALSAAQLNASANVPGTFAYSPAAGTMLTAGSHTLGVTFTPTDSTDYTTATASVPLSVNKATPVITWPAPAPIAYGTALSATQLNATATVPGTFAYTPAAGTILPVGTNTLNLVFTPTDTADYTPANASVTLVVNPAPSFTLTASPSSLSVKQGNNASSTISVNPINGFTGTVSLSVSGLPKNVTATFSPNPTTKMSTVTFTASNGASLGSSLLTITGKSGSVVQTTTITLTVLHK
jgi:hypothetical protein